MENATKALEMADDAGLDLVLISPNQAPPVAKILDYGKYKYELAKKAKEAYLEANENRVVKLEFIENGAHGFSKKHDVLALNAIKEFLA